MATSGSRDFDLDIGEVVEEAYERCGLEVRTGYESRTARRSLNLMFSEWANRGVNLWTVGFTTQTVASGVSAYPVNTITLIVKCFWKFYHRRDYYRRIKWCYSFCFNKTN